jgi:hypothetical protein
LKSLARIALLVAASSLLVAAHAAASPVRSVSIPVTIEGTAQVDFTSNAETGCERRCDISGSVTWDPSGRADLEVSEYTTRGKRELEASLFFFGGLGQDAPRTTAHVMRVAAGGSPGVCSDARVNEVTFLDFSAGSDSHVDVRLLKGRPDDSNLFRSRCGGPLERDLAAAMPSASLDRSRLAKGGTTVDLSDVRPFAAGGFAGIVRSSIKLRLGRASDSPVPAIDASRRPPAFAPRSVIAVYEIEQIAGTVVTDFTGGIEGPLCDPLDVCGASGTVRLSPLVSSGRATFVAYGPAKRVSGRELRSALGLRAGPRVGGITASGVADWSRDSGSAFESFVDADGTSCTDTVPLAGGFMTFWVGPRRVFAGYARSSGGGPDPLRTHCPGPSILDAAQIHPLATGTVPRRAFRKRRVVITLSRGRNFESEPYAGHTRPALKIVLVRKRVRETLGFDGQGGL